MRGLQERKGDTIRWHGEDSGRGKLLPQDMQKERAVGLRIIPFTRKLSDMVEDTLFGLILALIMSALVLGVTANVLTNYNNSIFNTAIGSQPDILAILAIFAAILMPTVFAPLTGIMMQTVSQAAMTGVGVATSIAAGVGGVAAKGVYHGAQAGMGAFSQALQQAGSAKSLGQAVKTGFGALTAGAKSFAGTFLRHAGPHVLKNAALIGATGVATAFGASGAAQAVSHMAGGLSTPADVTMSYLKEQGSKAVESDFNAMEAKAAAGIPHLPSKLGKKTGKWFVPNNRDLDDQPYYRILRKEYLNTPNDRFVENLVHAKYYDKKVLSNQKAIDEIARKWKDRIRSINTKDREGRLLLRNLKNQLDYRQFLADEGMI